jgi:hypothetical protein
MARHGAYVVRDAGENTGSANPDGLYPYTLHGLLAAMEDARMRSFGESPPQELLVIPAKGPRRVIRRYERGHEVPGSRLRRPSELAATMAPLQPSVLSGMS